LFQWERKANLSRFEGSSSISSADFFNGDSSRSGGSGGSGYSGQFVAPDLEDVKESVRQGVTKVAGKLSSLANGVVSTIQVSALRNDFHAGAPTNLQFAMKFMNPVFVALLR